MQTMQINQLPTIPQAPANADVLAIEVNGVTYKVSKQALGQAIASNITPAAIGAVATSAIIDIPHGGTGASNEQAMHTAVLNNTRTDGWTAYPTAAGIYRTTGTLWAGLPSGASAYGELLIVGAGDYYMHLYNDASGGLYYAHRSGTGAPSTWTQVVKGIKGNAESNYRSGNVNLTPANIGAMPVNPVSIEFQPASGTTHGGFIDFHFGGSSADYTTRLIEYQNGVLGVKKPNESMYYPVMLLRSVEINATTSANGNLQLPLSYSAGVPLAINAKTSGGANVQCAIGRYSTADNGYWGAKILNEITSGESPVALKNTAIVGTLYYVSM